MSGDRVRSGLALLALLIASASLYVSAGIAHAYFAADDFQWLTGGQTFVWARLVPGTDHFYRPMIDIWFAVMGTVCGQSSACYHIATLAVHLVNVSLVFSCALLMFRDLRVAFLGTLLFALEPAYTQAVVWISAITGLLATGFYLGSMLTLLFSWRARTPAARVICEVVVVTLFGFAILSHEAAITFPVMAWLMFRQFGPDDWLRRPVLAAGSAAVVVCFVALTMIANHRNSVFVESHYAFGFHAVRHAFVYFVALYVGPGWWLAYVACAIGLGILLIATPITRFGALWLIVTLTPYLWFTWENTSRYLYLPSIGFAWAIAGAVAASCDAIVRRDKTRRAVGQVAFLLMTAFVAVRFGNFDSASIKSQIRQLESWRGYADTLNAEAHTVDGVLHATVPDEAVLPGYLEPMLQWIRRDFRLTVVVDP